jgi:hypothetical protein
MAETPSEPRKLKRPIVPRNATRLSVWSAGAAVLVLLAGVQAYYAGWSVVASPGPIAAVHAPINASCAQCHASNRADDLRCERCHDPLDSRHFGTAAHVLVGAGDAWQAGHAEQMPCASCHVEHQRSGQVGELRLVDDRRCGACHGFRSFADHPEFALIRSGAKSELGLQLSHTRHLEELARTGRTERCLMCHEPTADEKTFQPISFDRHCAQCHLQDGLLIINKRGGDLGATGSVASDVLLPVGTPRGTISAPDSRGRQVVTGFAHRDPWILERLQRVSVVIDPGNASSAGRRAQLARAIGAAEAAAAVGAIAGLRAEELDRWAQELRGDLAAIDQQQAAPRGALSAESQTALRDLAAAVAPADPALAQTLAAAATPPPAPGPPNDEARRAQLESERAALRQLLDAIDQRGDAAAKKAVADLRKRADALAVAPATDPTDEAVLLDRLDALEHAFGVVERQAGAMLAAELRTIADLARQQIAGGIGGADFAARRTELLALLDALEPRADAVQKRRLADLRAAVRQLAAGDHGGVSLVDRRADKLRQLERVLLQRELGRQPDGPTDRTILSQRAAMRTQISELRGKLDRLAPPPVSLPALPATVDATAAKRGVNALLQTCLTCHQVNADESGLVPVRSGLEQLVQANFSHREHTGQSGCESCHKSAETSASGMDILVPNVASCQTCHKSGGQGRATCASCHTFHSRTGATLGVARR